MIRITLLLISLITTAFFSGIITISAATLEYSKKNTQDITLTATDYLLCGNQTRSFEKILGIPSHLLTAISLVEVGKMDKNTKSLFAWPWTIMVRGKIYYLPSKEMAISKVHLLQAKGIKNIGVGCMLINLHDHPKAFKDLNAAFDPKQNVGYAANFLAELHQSSLSWPQATSNYHSTTISKNYIYLNKVLNIWQKISKKNIRNSGFRFSPDPAYSNPTSRSAQTRVLKSRFRARLRVERKTNLPDKKKQDLDAWRRGRFDKELYKKTMARKNAKRAITDKNSLNAGKKSFSQTRQSQLSEWRKNRNGSAFRK